MNYRGTVGGTMGQLLGNCGGTMGELWGNNGGTVGELVKFLTFQNTSPSNNTVSVNKWFGVDKDFRTVRSNE